jgi:hypothetical protein
MRLWTQSLTNFLIVIYDKLLPQFYDHCTLIETGLSVKAQWYRYRRTHVTYRTKVLWNCQGSKRYRIINVKEVFTSCLLDSSQKQEGLLAIVREERLRECKGSGVVWLKTTSRCGLCIVTFSVVHAQIVNNVCTVSRWGFSVIFLSLYFSFHRLFKYHIYRFSYWS